MNVFRTSHERRLWLLAAGTTLLVYGSAFFAQRMLDPLRSRGLLGSTVWVGLVMTAALAVALVVRERPGVWEVWLLLAAAGAYLLMVRHLTIFQERIHLIEYGVIGGLLWGALRERWRDAVTADWRRSPAFWAIPVAGAIGWGDEVVQGQVPNRVYDLRDVATNAEAAAILVLVLAARARLRGRRATAAIE